MEFFNLLKEKSHSEKWTISHWLTFVANINEFTLKIWRNDIDYQRIQLSVSCCRRILPPNICITIPKSSFSRTVCEEMLPTRIEHHLATLQVLSTEQKTCWILMKVTALKRWLTFSYNVLRERIADTNSIQLKNQKKNKVERHTSISHFRKIVLESLLKTNNEGLESDTARVALKIISTLAAGRLSVQVIKKNGSLTSISSAEKPRKIVALRHQAKYFGDVEPVEFERRIAGEARRRCLRRRVPPVALGYSRGLLTSSINSSVMYWCCRQSFCDDGSLWN